MKPGIKRIIASGGYLLGLALVYLAAIGCGGGPKFEGDWAGDRGLVAKPGADTVAIATLSRVKLTFTANTFTLSDGGLPKSGTYVVQSGNAVMFINRVFERSDSANVPLTAFFLGKDTISFEDPTSVYPDPVTLKLVAK